MAPEKAAKPAQPYKAALGPAFAAKMAPVEQPAAIPFTMSFLARYYRIYMSLDLNTLCLALMGPLVK